MIKLLSKGDHRMIPDFSIRARSSNNKAKVAFIVGLAAAFAVFTLSALIDKYQGLVGLAALALLVFALTVFTKYLSVTYYYEITTDSEGVPLLLVRQQTGKRQSVLCRIGLAEIVKVEREDRATRRAHKTPAGFIKYTYFPTLDPEFSYRLTSTSRYEKAELVLEISDEMAGLLRKYSVMAREQFPDED